MIFMRETRDGDVLVDVEMWTILSLGQTDELVKVPRADPNVTLYIVWYNFMHLFYHIQILALRETSIHLCLSE